MLILKQRGMILAAVILLLMIEPLGAAAETPPSIPYRISGIVIVDGRQVTTDGEDYRFVVTRPDMTSFCPAAQDKDGINPDSPYNYSIDIPVWGESQQEGAKPDEPMVLRVYKNGTALTVVSPVEGRLVMMPSGTFERFDIEIKTPSAPGDINDDGRIGLEEAIHALQVVAGIRQE